jgi:broad specificity phosphatase PhoE
VKSFMAGRIITVRHGRRNVLRDLKISAREYGAWWRQYDASGLHPDEEPPPALVRLADGAKTVLSSTLPRAIETARDLTGAARAIPADPVYVEAALPPPPAPSWLKLSPGAWGVVSRLMWSFGYAPAGVENIRQAWRRVDEIVGRLDELAKDGDVVLCAHGFLNWMIDWKLKRAGWRRRDGDGGHHYWSWRVYEAARPNAGARAPAIAE